ncbi:hypothetical protein J4714_13460 [Staphylococcus epidermidis]|nr:hypothetical protein [Staphylococcus epidermidis]
MHWLKILTPLCAVSMLTVAAPLRRHKTLVMPCCWICKKHSVRAISRPLTSYCRRPAATRWSLGRHIGSSKNRLETAAPDEIQGFLTRYAGTYQEDRLRNDWLLLLGKQRDWSTSGLSEVSCVMTSPSLATRCWSMPARAAQRPMGQQVRELWMS